MKNHYEIGDDGVVLETDRLLLRELTESDFLDLCELLKDPQVIHAYEHSFSDADIRDWLHRQRERYRRDGFGLWAVIVKETGELAGQAGLTLQPFEGDTVLEVGYLLKGRFRHRGYAKEAAQGCIQYAYEKLDASSVSAIVAAVNTPSQKVAQSLGMKVEREFFTEYYGVKRPHFLYTRYR